LVKGIPLQKINECRESYRMEQSWSSSYHFEPGSAATANNSQVMIFACQNLEQSYWKSLTDSATVFRQIVLHSNY